VGALEDAAETAVKLKYCNWIRLQGTALALSAHALGGPPKAVIEDLGRFQVSREFRSVRAMPYLLRHALAKTFEQSKLWMANPKEPMNEMRGFYVGLPNEKRPERRLIVGFETDRFFYVYYEQAHPWSASALVFSKVRDNKKPLLWGGADIRMPPYDRTPGQLRNRILKNRLDDSKNFFW
jgi:hypothetical protein